MKHGFIKVAAVTPKIKVADVRYNGEEIRRLMKEASDAGARIVVFPELCITGYTCGDLFLQELLLMEARTELNRIAVASEELPGIFFVGLPVVHEGKLYNVAAAVSEGEILGFVPKRNIPNYNEFYEKRYFTEGMEEVTEVPWDFSIPGEKDESVGLPRRFRVVFDPNGDDWDDLEDDEDDEEYDDDYEMEISMGTRLLFAAEGIPDLKIGAEICEDLWTAYPPSIDHAIAGASVIVNLSASDEVTGKAQYRRTLVAGQAARLQCGYIYASAGEGESTQDVVYAGHDMIAENGTILAEAEPFSTGMIITELDIARLMEERRRKNTFPARAEEYEIMYFTLEKEVTVLTRHIDPAPFVPADPQIRQKRCDEILNIQAYGLKKRLEHTGSKRAIIGISGGLDSTLALLVTVRAFDLLSLDHAGIAAVTMPGFGTTDRTYDNAVSLIKCLGAEFYEIPIRDAVTQHFADIGQDPDQHDITYENSQARERTQILMDLANRLGGLVIGTGDMSELALGWATYNGDHMSMYGVNASVPKTLVRHLVRYYADTCGDETLNRVLLDVLDTPVSPELLPPKEGKISQKTEDLVGPYELHDFFLYQVLRFGSSPAKVLRLAEIAFAENYSRETIKKWLTTFYRRFFAQHFKRSCLPDGPKVGSVAVSPRGDLRMPSDAASRLWLDELTKTE